MDDSKRGFRVEAIHHAQVTIPKGAEAAAREFYVGTLGLTEVPKPEALQGRGGFWLAVGALQVHVGTEEGVDRSSSKAHVAYRVTGLGPLRAQLAAVGIDALDGIPIPGFERFEIRDPFGNRVEFIEASGSDGAD